MSKIPPITTGKRRRKPPRKPIIKVKLDKPVEHTPRSERNSSSKTAPVIAFESQQRERSVRLRSIWYEENKAQIKSLTLKQRAFLKAYTEELTITGAANRIGIDQTCHIVWKRISPTYRALFEDLKEYVVESLEGEVFRRAYHGVQKTVYYQGEPCGIEVNFSDTLAMFLLRAANPEKYRERSQMDMNIKPVDADINPAFRSVSVEALREIRKVLEEDQLKHKLIENGDSEQKSA